jgi:tetratricopeptide (TPR) repeat protein
MDREEECKEARYKVWDRIKYPEDRIKKLEDLASQYPEYIDPLSDIAELYLKMGDIENTIKTYQRIIDLKDTFESFYEDDLGKAYLFLNNYEKAIELLESSEDHVSSYSLGLFVAFAYLKKGDKKKFEEKFDKWIKEDIEKSLEKDDYEKYIKALFSDKESNFIEKRWNKYYDKYSNMEPYKLYCEIYKQTYPKLKFDKDEFDNDFKIPDKLSKSRFEQLVDEYSYLNCRAVLGDANKAELDQYLKLRDILFAEIILE